MVHVHVSSIISVMFEHLSRLVKVMYSMYRDKIGMFACMVGTAVSTAKVNILDGLCMTDYCT